MSRTVTVREATETDIEPAVALWTMSHVVRRNGRLLPGAHIASAHHRMAAPGALLLLAYDPTDGATGDTPQPASAYVGHANDTAGRANRSPAAAGRQIDREAQEGEPKEDQHGLIGTILGIQGRDKDGLGPSVPGLIHISLLSVAPDRWGQHVGRLLVQETINRAVARGFEQAQLWTHADNLRAKRLYKAMNFRRSGRVRVDDWGELLVHYCRALRT